MKKGKEAVDRLQLLADFLNLERHESLTEFLGDRRLLNATLKKSPSNIEDLQNRLLHALQLLTHRPLRKETTEKSIWNMIAERSKRDLEEIAKSVRALQNGEKAPAREIDPVDFVFVVSKYKSSHSERKLPPTSATILFFEVIADSISDGTLERLRACRHCWKIFVAKDMRKIFCHSACKVRWINQARITAGFYKKRRKKHRGI